MTKAVRRKTDIQVIELIRWQKKIIIWWPIVNKYLLAREWRGTLECKSYWSPKFYSFIHSLDTFNKSWLVGVKNAVKTIPPINLSYRMGNFVYPNWGCTLIYLHCLIPDVRWSWQRRNLFTSESDSRYLSTRFVQLD